MTQNALGWVVPAEPFDYRNFERTALDQQAAIKGLLDKLKAERPRTAERELLRRRELRLLTDMYYEQRSNARLFAAKAQQRGQ